MKISVLAIVWVWVAMAYGQPETIGLENIELKGELVEIVSYGCVGNTK